MKPHPTKSKPRIAPGHNPDNLTVEQVGKGWRLLTFKECLNRQNNHNEFTVDIESREGGRWDSTGWNGSTDHSYRTRKPPGYFLPKKPKPAPSQPGGRVMWEDHHGCIWHYREPGLSPVLVLDLSPEARERRVSVAWNAVDSGPPFYTYEQVVRAVLASIGDVPVKGGAK